MGTAVRSCWRALAAAAAVAGVLTACAREAPEPAFGPLDLPTRYPAPGRIVAFGDVHGDLQATRSVLRLAGAIDESDAWIGGSLAVVQTGDQLDRGDDEPEILDLLEAIGEQARAVGGSVHALNGNHELMNAQGDVRYVTLDGFADFLEEPYPQLSGADPQTVVDAVLARIKAFKPSRPQALRLAKRNVVTVVGGTVFVHGGVLPHVVEYGIERLNQETRQWLRGERPSPPEVLLGKDGPVWSRHYSEATDTLDCSQLDDTLERLGADRMVVGHTVQENGVTSACDDRVWRIDVGLASHYGGTLAALEITADGVRVLR
jgi:hypothetical protein